MNIESQSQVFSKIINNINNIDILVIGDIMLDKFVQGNVDRISPESPVPVLSIEKEQYMLGGAGNALSNLHSLGAKAHILTVIGNDESGEKIKEYANKMGVCEGFIIAQDRPTTVKTRYLSGHQQLLRTDYESKKPLSEAIEKQIIQETQTLLKANIKSVILSDYGKGVLSKSLLQALIKLCKKFNVPVLVDPKGRDYSLYAGASIVTPNKKELFEATGKNVDGDENIEKAARHIIDKHKIKSVIATRSQEGMSVIQKSQKEVIHCRSGNVEVYDVSGAGDTVISCLAACLAAGANIEEAAKISNIAGSIVVSKVGTAPIRKKELLDAIQTGNEPGRKRQALICNWEEAKEHIERWQAKNFSVGFTNGCFDILHYGHVSYLMQARDQCDRLIVALNKDSSVKILKGEERPIHNEHSRSHVLAALDGVDMVVFFGADAKSEDNTASELISYLKPNIYFKGGDYTQAEIPEAPFVESYGGIIKIMPEYEGHSTSRSVEKIKAA